MNTQCLVKIFPLHWRQWQIGSQVTASLLQADDGGHYVMKRNVFIIRRRSDVTLKSNLKFKFLKLGNPKEVCKESDFWIVSELKCYLQVTLHFDKAPASSALHSVGTGNVEQAVSIPARVVDSNCYDVWIKTGKRFHYNISISAWFNKQW